MKSILLALVVLTASGCAAVRNLDWSSDPYEKPPFYAKYLNTGSSLDAAIIRTLEQVRQDPGSAELHNQLGAYLVEKGFPNDAEREFERAIAADSDYYPAWYNLGLIRAMRGDDAGARRAYARAVRNKPGHAAALFQLGLIEEERGNTERAVSLYSKAFRINRALLDVAVNPRILDTELTHRALLDMYALEHAAGSMQFEGVASARAVPPQPPPAPSPGEAPQNIVPPSPPVTDPGVQTPPPQRRPRRRPSTPVSDN